MNPLLSHPVHDDGPSFAEGSLHGFASVAQDHRQQIFRFLLASLRDVDIAEELTQECLLRAYQHWRKFRGEASVTTWLMRIAINLQRDYWRNRRIQFWLKARIDSPELEDIGEWTPCRESSPEMQVAAKQQIVLLWKAVNRLRERQRTVFLLHYVEELKLSEISNATGLCEGTIKAHLSRALKKIRVELSRVR